MEKIEMKKSLTFLLITFLMSYALGFLIYFSSTLLSSLKGVLLSVLYMYMPFIGVLITQKFIYKSPLKELGISFKLNKWFLVAWLFPVILVFLIIFSSLIFKGVSLTFDFSGFIERFKAIVPPSQIEILENQIQKYGHFIFLMTLIQGLIAGVTVNALAAFGEEIGWRGFLLKNLKALGFWKSSFIIGFIWGLWHAPLILQGHNYPSYPVLGVFMMIVFCILLTPIINLVTLKGNSVIAASIFHGTINAFAGAPYLVLKGGNELTVGFTGVAGFIALLFVNILIFVFYKNQQ